MSLTRQHLDEASCFTPWCNHDHSVIYFHGRCHPQAPVAACYEKMTGEIVIRCARCEQLIARIAVAP